MKNAKQLREITDNSIREEENERRKLAEANANAIIEKCVADAKEGFSSRTFDTSHFGSFPLEINETIKVMEELGFTVLKQKFITIQW